MTLWQIEAALRIRLDGVVALLAKQRNEGATYQEIDVTFDALDKARDEWNAAYDAAYEADWGK